MKPKVAFIGTGGTIASLGKSALDIIDYGANDVLLHAEEIIARVPEVNEVADVIPISFRNLPSSHIYFDEWKELVLKCDELVASIPDLAGIVIGHGTATLEETAYFLGLTLKVPIPVVLVGSQRPLSALSSDAGLNLVNAICVAASPLSRGRGVLVCLNDEIQAARDVTKTSTARMQTFRTPDFGILGQVDGQVVHYYRRAERRQGPDTEFDIRALAALPRVDIVFSYAGSDGAAVETYVEKGAVGIVSAGFAPSMGTPAEIDALKVAVAKGVTVVQATRVGSGRTARVSKEIEAGFINSDNLTPQKARLLLALALTVTRDPTDITRMFATF
jgi:L-asparaginase